MILRMLPLAAVLVLMLSACQETASETAVDVAVAREEADQSVELARKNAHRAVAKANDQFAKAQDEYASTDENASARLSAAGSEAMIVAVKADFDVASAQVQARFEIASEQCDAFAGVEKETCRSKADAARAREAEVVTLDRDAALLAAEKHD